MNSKTARFSVVALWCCLYFVVSSSALRPISTLDDFSGNQLLIGVISDSSVFPFSLEGFYTSPNVLGGERDLELVVTSGPSGAVFTAGVNNDDLSSSSPYMGNAFTVYQLDGADSSTALNENGLESFDLTFAGTGSAFRLVGLSDLPTSVEFFVYTASGRLSYELEMEEEVEEKEYIVEFDNFSGDGDFEDVGAIEIQFGGNEKVDVQFSFFGVVGPEIGV